LFELSVNHRWRNAASLEMLEKLANDERAFVRCCVAEGRNTPVHLLAKLAEDSNEEVRHLAAERLATSR
jgi:hypothetical protein